MFLFFSPVSLQPGADTGASLFARYRRRRTTQVSLADQKGLLSESEDSDDDDQQPGACAGWLFSWVAAVLTQPIRHMPGVMIES
jgi:hypothetical protein